MIGVVVSEEAGVSEHDHVVAASEVAVQVRMAENDSQVFDLHILHFDAAVCYLFIRDVRIHDEFYLLLVPLVINAISHYQAFAEGLRIDIIPRLPHPTVLVVEGVYHTLELLNEVYQLVSFEG